MTSLVLHVGPAKCGSSSIQQFFAAQKNPCVQNTHYMLLNHLEIEQLNFEEPGASILATFAQLLSENLNGYDVLILSHEYLFECPHAIKNICNLARDLTTQISIIGYSRRQADWLISAYSQWFFRLPNRIKEASDVLRKLELDPVLFSGLERHLIDSIVNDFHKDHYIYWHEHYQRISQLIQDSGAVIKCGLLPNQDFDTSLIQDFCAKSDLTLRDEMRAVSNQIHNPSFNKNMVEAIDLAVELGLEMPGPHEHNDVLELLSATMAEETNDLSDFLSNLKSYIDTYFLTSNHQFSQEYGLSEFYFATPVQFSKRKILDVVIKEGRQRVLNKSVVINNYRLLSARLIELCWNLAKKQNDPNQY